MNRSGFYGQLKKYLNGTFSNREKVRFDKWLDSLNKGEEENISITDADHDRVFQKISASIDQADDQQRKLELPGYRLYKIKLALKIAASILLLLAVTYGILNVASPAQTSSPLAAADATIKKLILQDGSIVWLKGGSKLSYFQTPDGSERHASLQGEGLFEVAKDPLHPFFIQCGALQVKVLGTSFNLKTGISSLELKVLTGKVSLSSETDKKGMIIEPYQKVTYTGKSSDLKILMDRSEAKEIMSRTEYDMQFSNSTMDKVMERIAQKFNVKFEIESPKLNHCRITADFTDHSLDSTLQMISEVLNFQYKISGDKIALQGEGCN